MNRTARHTSQMGKIIPYNRKLGGKQEIIF